MKKYLFLVTLLFFPSQFIFAANLNFIINTDFGDSIFLDLQGFDFITYPNPSIDSSSNAQNDGLSLVPNSYFTPNGVELSPYGSCTSFRNCSQPNSIYVFTFQPTGDTLTIQTNSQNLFTFLPTTSTTFNSASVQLLTLTTLQLYGYYVFIIISSILIISVSYLIFIFGLNKILYDRSLNLFGFYLRDLPFKGYNRFRSKKWNLKNLK